MSFININSRRQMKAIAATLGILLVGGCATSYNIDTKPSDVEVLEDSKSIGKTPLSFDESQLNKPIAGGRLLTLRKKGFRDIKIWVPADGRKYNIQINLNPFFEQTLIAKNGAQIKEVPRRKLFNIMARLLRIQQNLLSEGTGNESSATDIQELDKLLESNPTIGSLHYLKSIDLLRKGDKANAALFLTDATRFAPFQTDFILLKNEVDEGK